MLLDVGETFCMETLRKGRAAGTPLWGRTGERCTVASGVTLLGALDCMIGDLLPTGMSIDVPTVTLGTGIDCGAVDTELEEMLGYGFGIRKLGPPPLALCIASMGRKHSLCADLESPHGARALASVVVREGFRHAVPWIPGCKLTRPGAWGSKTLDCTLVANGRAALGSTGGLQDSGVEAPVKSRCCIIGVPGTDGVTACCGDVGPVSKFWGLDAGCAIALEA